MKSLSAAARPCFEQLPDRIRRMRRQARLSQAALARDIGVSASAVAQWEQAGGTRPDLHHLVLVARIVRVSLDWLVTGEGKSRTRPSSDEVTIAPDAYANDLVEESLLRSFRRLPARARRHLVDLIEHLGPDPGRHRKRG